MYSNNSQYFLVSTNIKKVTSLFPRNLRLNIVNYLQNLYAIFSEKNNKRRKETAANNILLH